MAERQQDQGVADVLIRLRHAGVRAIRREGDSLYLSPRDVLTEELRGAARAHKCELHRLLQEVEGQHIEQVEAQLAAGAELLWQQERQGAMETDAFRRVIERFRALLAYYELRATALAVFPTHTEQHAGGPRRREHMRTRDELPK